VYWRYNGRALNDLRRDVELINKQTGRGLQFSRETLLFAKPVLAQSPTFN
jgi:hypothetical protein